MRFTPGGPAVEGSWRDPATAVRKSRSFIGTHGSVDEVLIVLAEETETGWRALRTWAKEHGEEIHVDRP